MSIGKLVREVNTRIRVEVVEVVSFTVAPNSRFSADHYNTQKCFDAFVLLTTPRLCGINSGRKLGQF